MSIISRIPILLHIKRAIRRLSLLLNRKTHSLFDLNPFPLVPRHRLIDTLLAAVWARDDLSVQHRVHLLGFSAVHAMGELDAAAAIRVFVVPRGTVTGERAGSKNAPDQRPEHRNVGDVDCGRRLADVPEHVDCCRGIAEVVVFAQYRGEHDEQTETEDPN